MKFIMWFLKVLVYYLHFICADHMFNIYFFLFMIINFACLRRFKKWTYFYMQMDLVNSASNLLCCVILLVL